MSKPNTPAAAATNATTPAPTEHKDQNHKPKAPSNNNNQKATVLALPGNCLAEECKARSEKANFCMEHFDWFKEGLITKEGRRPTDFEKKFSDYTRRHRKSA